ncbi:WhiB family transcriptional regulator [Nocardia suismassiliense]|uniref:WhiB family transcriptional regulator n=1 Tax=Nocardia suismassiliense TaxID=2077092 RepID=UPI000D1EB075|nr:WhiB family transcriptional regulator [Nocardia suismassiliense]
MKLRTLGGQSWFGSVEREPESWRREAACAETDPDAFFPERGGNSRDAKRVCSSCEVVRQCLDYALGHDQNFGVWGGMTPPERHRFARRGISARSGRTRAVTKTQAPPK